MLDLPHRYSFRGHAVAWGALGSGPPLVMIHGTPFSAQVWRRVAPHVATRHRVYVFDLLGYGQSEKCEGQDVSLGVQNDLLAELFGEWDLTAPAVVAHDFGGATALRALYLNGLRYGSLTLIDPVAVAPWGSPFVQHVREHEAAFTGLPAYAHDAMLAAYLQSAAHRTLPDDALRTYMAPWQGPTGQAAFYRQIAQMDQSYTDAVEPLYGPMDMPVRLIWGREDQWIPVDRGRALARRLGLSATIVAEAGHLVQDDAPEAVVAALMAPAAD